MKITLLLLTIGIVLLVIPLNISQPSFNIGTGCDGSGCHDLEDGITSVSVNGFQIEVTVNGTSSSVAGELVDSTGVVVTFNNSTSNNPFTLTAPGPGNYIVNAGFKNPNPRRWDSAMVNISVTDVKGDVSNPSVYNLFNNYPNPFNPSTVIKYSIPQESFVTLKIYDAIGNEIYTLVNETERAGSYEVNFNADQLSGGIYFYKLHAGSFVETKKMILLR